MIIPKSSLILQIRTRKSILKVIKENQLLWKNSRDNNIICNKVHLYHQTNSSNLINMCNNLHLYLLIRRYKHINNLHLCLLFRRYRHINSNKFHLCLLIRNYQHTNSNSRMYIINRVEVLIRTIIMDRILNIYRIWE